jgi:hypothetical protein
MATLAQSHQARHRFFEYEFVDVVDHHGQPLERVDAALISKWTISALP